MCIKEQYRLAFCSMYSYLVFLECGDPFLWFILRVKYTYIMFISSLLSLTGYVYIIIIIRIKTNAKRQRDIARTWKEPPSAQNSSDKRRNNVSIRRRRRRRRHKNKTENTSNTATFRKKISRLSLTMKFISIFLNKESQRMPHIPSHQKTGEKKIERKNNIILFAQ